MAVDAIDFAGGVSGRVGRQAGRGQGSTGGGGGRRRRGGRALGLALPRLDAVLAHGLRPVDAVQFVVEAAGVAHRLPFRIPPPQRRRRRPAVGAAEAQPPCRTLPEPNTQRTRCQIQ